MHHVPLRVWLHAVMIVCVCENVCDGLIDAGPWMFFKKQCCVGGDNSLGMGGCNCPFHSLLMLTCSKGSVYKLLPTACTTSGKKTSFQDRRGAENLIRG